MKSLHPAFCWAERSFPVLPLPLNGQRVARTFYEPLLVDTQGRLFYNRFMPMNSRSQIFIAWITPGGQLPILALIGLIAGGCATAPQPPVVQSEEIPAGWTVPVGAKLEGLQMFDGWTDPREVKGDVNAPGWPDSSYILGSASKGYELHYSYCRHDFERRILRHKLKDIGVHRAGQTYPGFNLYKATVKDGAWVSEWLPFNPPGPLDYAAGGMAAGGSPYVFVRFETNAPGAKHGTATIMEVARDADGKWGVPAVLPYPVNTNFAQDNPTLSADGLTLYFDSDRKDAAGNEVKPPPKGYFNGGRTLYVSHFRDGHWSDPVAVAGAPNAAGTSNMQPFLSADGRELYWTGHDRGSPAINCFYRATRQPDGSFQNPVLVAEPTKVGPDIDGKVIALGESSVSEDGELLAFVFVRARITWRHTRVVGPADRIEIGIALARRIHD